MNFLFENVLNRVKQRPSQVLTAALNGCSVLLSNAQESQKFWQMSEPRIVKEYLSTVLHILEEQDLEVRIAAGEFLAVLAESPTDHRKVVTCHFLNFN